ncbi:MAG: M28 family peptidase [Candidatus Eisenbacteria bacterium]
MKRLLVVAVALLPILHVMAVQSPVSGTDSAPRELVETALVAVENPDLGTAASLLERGITVVRDMERYLLVTAGTEDLIQMDEMGLDWSMLDRSIAGKSYFTVTVARESRLLEIPARVRVLRFDGFDAVVEASQEEAMKLVAGGLDIARVFMRPVRAVSEQRVRPLGLEPLADPAIQTMVDAVSGTSVDGFVQRLQDFETRYATHDSCQAAADWIKAELESYGIDSVYFHNFSGTYKDNVVAVIPGSGDPSKIVVVGGHYDSYTSNPSYCPGADDNASGTACMLECARVLCNYEFNYTLAFVAFGGEEFGLYGSEGFASDAAIAGDDIIAAICVDMIGYLAGGDVMDLDVVDNASSEWIRDIAMAVGTDYVPGLPIVDGAIPSGSSSDHASFWANGFDAVLLFEDSGNYSPYIHTADDVVGTSYNSPTLAELSVKVAVGMVATIAEPFSVAISHTPLENTEDTVNPYRVVANIVAAGTLNGDSLLVYYSTGGGMSPLTMSSTGTPDEYEAFIPAQVGGTWVDYYIVAEDTEGTRATHPTGAPAEVHTFFVGTITAIVEHDFESDQGWTVGDTGDNATTGIWERCDPEATEAQPEDDHTPDPGVRAYITTCAAGASQGTNDVDGGKTTLLSPVFDLSTYSNAWVRYHRWYSNDTGASPEDDDWIVDVSADAGSTWVRLETLTSSNRTWHMVERNLSDYIELTSDVKFRFIAADNDPGSIVEAGIDDFSIVFYDDGLSGLTDAGNRAHGGIMLDQNVPNPFSPQTAIRFTVPEPGREVTLRVFDVSGREVKTLLKDEKVAGSHTVHWNGTNDAGEEIAAGLYFCRLVSGDIRLSRKIVLVR